MADAVVKLHVDTSGLAEAVEGLTEELLDRLASKVAPLVADELARRARRAASPSFEEPVEPLGFRTGGVVNLPAGPEPVVGCVHPAPPPRGGPRAE